jgi:hypothetical protein
MQHHRPLVGVEHRAGHENVAGGGAGGEDLAGVDAIAALDLLGLAGARDPVGAATREQHDALGRDALEQRLDRGRGGLLVRPAPGRDGDLMGVHGESKSGRAAVIGERAQHGGELIDVGAAAAELAGHARLDQARRLEERDVVCNVDVLVGRRVGATGQGRTQFARDLGGAARRRGGDLDG